MGMHLQTSPAALSRQAAPSHVFRRSTFDQRLGISFTGWDPGRFDLNVQVNVLETQYLYKIFL
jgi:hypothetical protein